MLRVGSTAVLAAVVLGAGAARAVTVVDSTLKVRPTDSPQGTTSATLRAARGEFEPFQIVVSGGAAGKASVSASASALIGSSGTIPASEVRLYRLGYLNITTPSNIEGATGRWPDPMIPDVDEVANEKRKAFPFDIPAGENRVIFVDLHVPTSAVPGVYTGSITVSGLGWSEIVPITLTVLDFVMPATSSLPTTYGMHWSLACVAHFGSYDACGRDAGILKMNTMYARYMLDHRLTSEVVYTGPTASSTGFDWSGSFDPHYAPLLDGTAPGLLDGASLTSFRYRWPREVSRYQEWARHFREKGWLSKTFDYTCDEPPMTCEWTDIPVRAALVRQGDSELRTLVTTNIEEAAAHGVDDDIDVMVPLVNQMHDRPGSGAFEGDQRSKYDAFLQSGPRKELWWYQCCMSHGCGYVGGPETQGWPSFMVDISGVQNRAMQWLTFSYRISGELYYEVMLHLPNAWNSVFDFGGNGDGTLLYPGTPSAIGGTTHVPVASYRLKMIREGMEDYEYLKRLADLGDRAFATSVARDLFPTPYESRQPVEKVRAARDLLIDRLVQQSPPRLGAPSARGPVTVDGALSEFEGAPSVALSGTAKGSDSSAQIQVLWDTERLYVGYAVQDATQRINQGGADGEVWNGDGIEVMIDASANGSLTPDSGDFHVGVNVAGDVRDERGGGPDWDRSWTSGATHAVTRTPTGYTVELAIPWNSMGLAPGAGTEVGFDIAVNDSDAAGEVKPFDWAGLTRFAQPARWGRLTLEGSGSNPGALDSGGSLDNGGSGAGRSVRVMGCAMAGMQTGSGGSAGVGAHLPLVLLVTVVFFASRRGSSKSR
jgi:hypothetical protein